MLHAQTFISSFEGGASNNVMPWLSGCMAYQVKPLVVLAEYRIYYGREAPGSKDWRFFNTAGTTAGLAFKKGRILLTAGAYAHLYQAPKYGFDQHKIFWGGVAKFYSSDRHPYGVVCNAGFDGRQFTIGFGAMGKWGRH